MTFLSIASRIKAAEPYKQHFALTPALALTRAQANAAVDIADAIFCEQTYHDQANITKVQSIYNEFFAKDLARSASKDIEVQSILAQSLINAVKTRLVHSTSSLTALNNDAGRLLFDLIYESQLSEFEQLPALVQSEIVKNLTDQELAHLAQTSKRELAVIKEEMKKRSTFYWKSKKFNLSTLTGHTACINALTFSQEAAWLVSGSSDKSIIIWDVKNLKKQRQISNHNEAVTAVALSPNGQKIASSSVDQTVRVWDFNTGNETKQFPIFETYSPVAFSHNNELLAFLSSNMTVEICDIERPSNNKTHKFLPDLVQIAFSPNDQILSALNINRDIDADSALYFWAINKKINEITQIDVRIPSEVVFFNRYLEVYGPYAAAISPDLNFCALAWGKNFGLWSADPKRKPTPFIGHEKNIFAIAFSSDSKIIASSDLSGRIMLWNTEKPQSIVFFNIGIPITALAFSPDDKILAAGSKDGIIKLIKPQ